jgi:hypothetical protein
MDREPDHGIHHGLRRDVHGHVLVESGDHVRERMHAPLLDEERSHAKPRLARRREHADHDLTLRDEEPVRAHREIAIAEAYVRIELRGAGSPDLDEASAHAGLIALRQPRVSRASTSAWSGKRARIAARSGISKSAKSKPGATVHPHSA